MGAGSNLAALGLLFSGLAGHLGIGQSGANPSGLLLGVEGGDKSKIKKTQNNRIGFGDGLNEFQALGSKSKA